MISRIFARRRRRMKGRFDIERAAKAQATQISRAVEKCPLMKARREAGTSAQKTRLITHVTE